MLKRIALTFASCALLVACGGAPSVPATPEAPAAPAVSGVPSAAPAAANATPGAKAVKPMGEAGVGDTTNCPVSGEEFVVTAASPKVDYQGKTYYFCCGGCDKKFQADPAKYLSKKPKG
jgi:Cu+-exporting ATPase